MPLLVANVLPDYVVMLFLTLALVLPGLVPPADILGGFAAPAWLMIFTLLAVGVAVARSGLMFRLVLLSLQRLPPRFIPQSMVLCLTGVLMSAGPDERLHPDRPRRADRPRDHRRHGVRAAKPGGGRRRADDVLHLPPAGRAVPDRDVHRPGGPRPASRRGARAQITWWRWFFIALPPFAVVGVVTYLSLLFRFKPHGRGRSTWTPCGSSRRCSGPLTRNEIWSAACWFVLIVGFASRRTTGSRRPGCPSTAFLFLFTLGALDQSAFQGGGTLGLLVYAGVILSLGNVFTTLHIDAWLTSLVQSGMPAMVRNPYGFVLTISVIAFLLHFFVPWMTASTIIALVAMPIAEGLGFHPFIPVLVALIAGDHTILPYVNSGYAIVYFASEGELFTHAQARWSLVLEGLLRPVALLLSVPVWQLMGLM